MRKFIDQNEAKSTNDLIKENTFFLAANIIAQPDFPTEEDIPKSTPFPFTNFGHQPLFDHSLLQTEIWNTIREIQNTLEPWKNEKSYILPYMVSVIISFALLFSFSYFFRDTSLSVISWILSLFLGIMIANSVSKNTISKRKKKLIEKVSNIKAEVLNGYLSGVGGKFSKHNNEEEIKEKIKNFGSGKFSADIIPVLTIMNNSDPFPGFGRMQLENTFVCRAEKDMESLEHTENDITQKVFDDVEDSIERLKIGDIYTGKIITIHGDSLTINSKWLDEEKTPILWVPKKDLDQFLQDKEDESSSRLYNAIQIVFPRYRSAATFFFRIFLAGNAASCHLAVSTIGPPIFDKKDIRKALMRYEQEKNKNDNQFESTNTHQEIKTANRLKIIRSLYNLSKLNNSFVNQNLDIDTILEIKDKELTDSQLKDYEKEFEKIIKNSTLWPGNIGLNNGNFRDANSYSLSIDFYERPELLSSIRTIYDQLSRSILDSFKSLGFNISAYKDSEGNYSINAEKIDELIIGEKIHIEESKSDAKKKDQPKDSQAD